MHLDVCTNEDFRSVSLKMKQQPKPLTGNDLIEKVKQLGNLSREEKAIACGYITISKNGSERIKVMAFLNALLDADGMNLDVQSQSSTGVGGRKPSYRVSVQSNGNILIGSAYTKEMDAQPGEVFEISLGRKHIHLKQIVEED